MPLQVDVLTVSEPRSTYASPSAGRPPRSSMRAKRRKRAADRHRQVGAPLQDDERLASGAVQVGHVDEGLGQCGPDGRSQVQIAERVDLAKPLDRLAGPARIQLGHRCVLRAPLEPERELRKLADLAGGLFGFRDVADLSERAGGEGRGGGARERVRGLAPPSGDPRQGRERQTGLAAIEVQTARDSSRCCTKTRSMSDEVFPRESARSTRDHAASAWPRPPSPTQAM